MRKNHNTLLNECGKADVLYICIGYTGYRMAGDKNFYIDLFDGLVESGLKIVVVSISDPPEGKIHIDRSTKLYPIIHIRRPLHFKNPQVWWTRSPLFTSYHHKHGFLKEYWERFITLLFWSGTINRIIKTCKPANVHFLDSFVYPMIKLHSSKKIITQPRYEKKAGLVYRFYLKALFSKVHTGIIFNKKQLEFYPKGLVKRKNFVVQPWGVRCKEQGLRDEERVRFMENPKNKLFLWSGYLQQIGYRDFLFAKNLAEEAVKRFPNVEFIFAFKPDVNIELPNSSDRIKFVKPASEFREMMLASDLLFSPLCSRETVIGPPLTWIEYISSKKPILTSNVAGLDSYFENNVSILSFSDQNEYLNLIEHITEKTIDLDVIGQNAFNVYREYFDLEKIIQHYKYIYET